jgi:hypothetical protein
MSYSKLLSATAWLGRRGMTMVHSLVAKFVRNMKTPAFYPIFKDLPYRAGQSQLMRGTATSLYCLIRVATALELFGKTARKRPATIPI